MTIEQIAGLTLALLVMCIGLAGAVLPGVPGPPLILLTAALHRLYFGAAGASGLALLVLTFLTILSLALDYIGSVYGARRLGATWRGVVGAVLGVMIGAFFALPGLILGPFLGAVALEMFGGREWKEAARAGVGAILGLFIGGLGKVACAVAMIGIFTISVVSRSQFWVSPP